MRQILAIVLLLLLASPAWAQPSEGYADVLDVGCYVVDWSNEINPVTLAQADAACAATAEKYRVLSRGQAQFAFRPAFRFTSVYTRQNPTACPIALLKSESDLLSPAPPPAAIFFIPGHPDCAGGKAAQHARSAVVNGGSSAGVVWHELGHAIFGWGHSDDASIMDSDGGNCCLTPYELQRARRLITGSTIAGWLNEGISKITVKQRGTYAFVYNDGATPGNRAVIVAHPQIGPTPFPLWYVDLTGQGITVRDQGGVRLVRNLVAPQTFTYFDIQVRLTPIVAGSYRAVEVVFAGLSKPARPVGGRVVPQ